MQHQQQYQQAGPYLIQQQYRVTQPPPHSVLTETHFGNIPDPVCPPSPFQQPHINQPPPTMQQQPYGSVENALIQRPLHSDLSAVGSQLQPSSPSVDPSLQYVSPHVQQQYRSTPVNNARTFEQPEIRQVPTPNFHSGEQTTLAPFAAPPQRTVSLLQQSQMHHQSNVSPNEVVRAPPQQPAADERLPMSSNSIHASAASSLASLKQQSMTATQQPQIPGTQLSNQISNGYNTNLTARAVLNSAAPPRWRPSVPLSTMSQLPTTSQLPVSDSLLGAEQRPASYTNSSPPLQPSYPIMSRTPLQVEPRHSYSQNGIYESPQRSQQFPCTTPDEDTSDTLHPSIPSQVKVETLTKNTNSRIDPAFVPRPALSIEPLSQPGGKRFETDKYTIPPPPYGVYTTVDRGSASCRFIRVSLNQLPTISQTLKSTGVPLVVVASPFPVQGEYEDPIPSVNLNKGSAIVSEDSETEGPPRCSRCHSYISPFMTFPDELSATCNFCGHTFMLPKHYQYALAQYTRLRTSADYNGVSSDPASLPYDRLEIIHGTIDWAAPSAFLQITGTSDVSRPTTKSAFYPGELCLPAPAFCFAIDTSASAHQSGFTVAALAAVKYALGTITNPATKVCILTFDQNIRFYPIARKSNSCNVSQSQQQIFTVSDVMDPFFPAHSNALFTNATETRIELETLLDDLPKLLQAELSYATAGAPTLSRTQSSGNAALQACVQLLSSRGGGAVKIFYGSSPDVGIGAIQKMNLTATTNKDHIAHPLHPVADLSTFYSELAGNCINNGVVVDVFIAAQPNRHIGVSTLGYASRRTGGHCLYYGNFNLNRGYQRLCMDLSRQLQFPQAYDCIFKIRCSRGFTVSKVLTAASLGIRDPRIEFTDPSQFRIPRIDADQSLLFELKHDGEVPEVSRAAYIQYAVLHTTMSGIRRIRVVTLALAVTNSLSTTFRYSEVESVLAYFVKKAANAVMTTSTTKWKEELTKELVRILFSYRINCAATTSAGQLILPDALKSLPVYISGLFKNAAFRSATDLFRDEKDFLLGRLVYAPLHQLILHIYPRLFVLHRSYSQFKGEKLQRIGDDTGLEGEVYLPPVVASSGEKITTDGLYLLDNGLYFMIYVGADVSPSVLNEVFETTELSEAFVSNFDCEELKGNLGAKINRAINQLRKNKGLANPWQPILLVRPKSLEESLFLWHLVEDKLGSEPSYVDFLCLLHKSVYHEMEDA